MEDEKLLKQEVLELTELLRRDPGWQNLRDAILGAGWRPDDVFLGGFYEDENGNEFGAVVTSVGGMFEFQRSSAPGSRGFKRWRQVDRLDVLQESFPAIGCALRMAVSARPPG